VSWALTVLMLFVFLVGACVGGLVAWGMDLDGRS
jgi:hypothetical protein